MEVKEIPVNKISPSPFQPREKFDKEEIQQLAGSIEKFDLLNPILVRPMGDSNYQIIAGERRWRAAQYARLETIYAIVKDIDDKRQKIESLIENIHRKDLHILEKGRAVLEIFRMEGIRGNPRTIAKEIKRIDTAERKMGRPVISEIRSACNIIDKSLPTLREWLNAISVDKEIIREEQDKNDDEKTDSHILSRLALIDDRDLQKKTYRKILEQDMGQSKATKFITQIKKLPKEEREAILTSNIPIEIIGDRTEGYSIDIPEEEIEKLRQAVEIGQRETEAVLLKPIVRERGLHRRNWQAHLEILTVLDNLLCPYCGKPASTHLRWLCHDDKAMDECKDRAGKNFEESGKREEVDPQFMKQK